HRGKQVDRFQNRKAVAAAAAQVVHLARSRAPVILEKQARDVPAMNLIANLFALVAPDRVFAAGDGADGDVSEVAVQLDRGVLRAGEAAAAEDADGRIEVAAELLAQDISRHFGSAEQRVQALIDRHALVDAVKASGIVVALLVLDQRQM